MTPNEEKELRKAYKQTRKANKCPWHSDRWSRAIIEKYDGRARQQDIKRYLRPTGARLGDMIALLNWEPDLLLGNPKAMSDYHIMCRVLDRVEPNEEEMMWGR